MNVKYAFAKAYSAIILKGVFTLDITVTQVDDLGFTISKNASGYWYKSYDEEGIVLKKEYPDSFAILSI
ncbi:hypothetical protein [uncultured Dokdonia sp.]|mgnify:CR=1 FL=1|uniref:hypothetical protein n=1 Tax=uncultured Dokdonia sp. TaxID=575653 RepID=UPI002622C0DE|nr:hypothetical protein [uncultured Dokdonia sp.]